MSHSASPFDTDVLIVGAGPAGLTLAAGLAARQVRSIVIDRQAEGANTSRAAVMNVGILDSMNLAEALIRALAGDTAALDAYGSERRPVAAQVVALADRLTRLATVRPGWRALRNLLLSTLARIPRVRRQLAWRLSGLVYR